MLIALGMALVGLQPAPSALAQGFSATQQTAPNPPPVLSPDAFRVINGTGARAVALHAVRSGRPDWGSNLLNRGPLAPNGGFALRPSPSAGCQFDLRLVLDDGREAVLREQDICAQREVHLASIPGASIPGAGIPGASIPGAGSPGVATLPPTPSFATPAPAPSLAPTRPGVAAPSPPTPSFAAPGVTTPAAPAPAPRDQARTPLPTPARPNPQARSVSGTGFVVATDRVLTNFHVVEGCARLLIRTPDGRLLAAIAPALIDAHRDLALLTVPGDPGPPLAFRSNPVRLGEAIVTYGFPLAGLLSSGPSLTTGEVSAMAGMEDNPTQYQVSAPVQAGNSGGPLLDRHGHVVGVIVSKLNAQRIAQRTGDIPQNVNFAVQGPEALGFLRRAGLAPTLAESLGPEHSAATVGEVANRSTLFIRCER